MANSGIEVKDMPAASQVNDADLLMIIQSDVNKKATKSQVIAGLQPTLTFDSTPTANSTNPVTSGGIKTYVDNQASAVYRYKGSVATYADLPSTGLAIGDVYNVESDGSNYAWTGTEWDKLGGDVDLSNYYTKSEIDSMIGDINSALDLINGEVI